MGKETNRDREDLRYGMPHQVINGVATDILCNAKGLYPDFSVEELSNLLSKKCNLPIEEATKLVKKAIALSDEE